MDSLELLPRSFAQLVFLFKLKLKFKLSNTFNIFPKTVEKKLAKKFTFKQTKKLANLHLLKYLRVERLIVPL